MNKSFVLFGLLSCISCMGQYNIGIPTINNYTKQTYGGGTQNWRIAQDKNSYTYFANNDGLISFDGTYWNIFYLPNKTIVRSVAIGTKGRIYVGGQGEIGYFSPRPDGTPKFTDLMEKIPLAARNFDDVWDIVTSGDQTFFRVRDKILHLNGEKFAFYETGNWRFLGSCNGIIFAQDLKNGLLKFQDGIFKPFLEGIDFKNEIIITGIKPYKKDTILIATYQHGLYFLTGNKALPLKNIRFQKEITSEINSIESLENGDYAIGTRNAGLYIIDRMGTPTYHYNLESGLQNQNILSITADKTGNIWLGLENGIDYVAHNDPIRKILPEGPKMGAGHTVIAKNGTLYAGTSSGLHQMQIVNTEDLSINPGPFKLSPETKGQVWSLTEINNQLLMGHHLGAYLRKDGKWINDDYTAGYWNFVPLQNVLPASTMIAGTYRGLSFFTFGDRGWKKQAKTLSFESSRFVIKFNNDIWVSHPYKGIFRIALNENYPDSFSLEQISALHGIKGVNNNYLFNIKNSLIATTPNGILKYDEKERKFKPSPSLDSLIPFKNIRYIKEDPKGNLWIVYDKSLVVVDFEGESPTLISIQELTNNLLNGFEFIYFFNNENVILAAEKGFYLINYPKYKKSKPDIKAHIRKLKVSGSKEEFIFAGFFGNGEVNIPKTDLKPGWKNIHFEYSAPAYGQQQIVEYSVRLDGYEKSWSFWSKRTEKEYTLLPPGDYTFLVRAKDNLGYISEPAAYVFTVLPPWYLTPLAYIFYSILLAGILYALYTYQQKTILNAHKKHALEQTKLKYLQQLEMDKAEKELVKLRNEKLETELELQNAELASATMHLVQKAEIINGIKEEMLKITRSFKSEISIPELKKLIRTLGDDEAIDSGWEQFAHHFDKVNSNFLVALKTKYPEITTTETKLCTYLRMNLSSKEIAQLMHITGKSVELSRYRLRKKLGLQKDEGLYDFLIKIGQDPETHT